MYQCELCSSITEEELMVNKISGLSFNEINYQLEFKKVNVCRVCLKKLHCGNCHSQYKIFLDVDNNVLCPTHKLNAMVYCPNCKEKKKYRHVYMGSCYPRIQNYWYKPSPKFKGKDDLYFGVELEVGGAKSKFNILNFMKDVKKNTDLLYFKRDGSIRNHGVEAVSHPATYEFHKNSDSWIKVFESLQINKIPEDPSCGLHFHVSKKTLTNKQIACIDAFVNTQDEFIHEMAGRELNKFCQKVVKEINNWGSAPSTFFGSGRYTSINLTNPNTIEYRIFASTNNYEIFMKRLKFVKDLTLCCRNTELSEILENKKILNRFKEFSEQTS